MDPMICVSCNSEKVTLVIDGRPYCKDCYLSAYLEYLKKLKPGVK